MIVRLAVRMAALLGAAASLETCVPEPIAGEVRYRTDHVTLHADPLFDVCEGSLDYGERFVRRTAAYLGVEPPQIDFSLYHVRLGQIPACPGAGGCTFGTLVLSGEWPHRHELVHAVSQLWGRAPAFLEEGLAEALGPQDFTHHYPDYALIEPIRDYPIEANLESIAFRADAEGYGQRRYHSVASFVRFVIHRYGIEALQNWYSSLTDLSDALTVRQEFARATGESLDVALGAWRASPPETDRRSPSMLQPLECYAPTVSATRPDTFIATRRLERCAVYRLEHDHTGYARDAISVETEGTYEVVFDGDLPDTVQIEPCEQVHGQSMRATTLSTMHLRPGRYYIAVTRAFDRMPEPAPITVRWAVSRVGN